jgi:thiol-disulfide isomerase/thioredoxin
MKAMILDPANTVLSPPRRVLRVFFLSLLVAGTVAAWFCRDPLRNLILEKGTLLNNAPTEEAMEQVMDAAKDRQSAIRSFWSTKKIVHREAAIRQLAHFIPAGKPIPVQLESWVLAAALDPDMDVREIALGILREHKHPALAAICLAQLQDDDPEVRQLGLDNLRPVSAKVGVPSVIPLLQDPDPRIVATSLKLLENWTGHAFGVKLADTVPAENKETGLLEYGAESKAKAQAGAERAQIWWAEHQAQFTPVHLELPATVWAALDPIPAGDFSLSTLDGRRVSLSDFHGKVVLINFWTTWCTACLGEMPALIELQKRHHEQLVILGISLDCVPDEDHDGRAGDRPSLNEIRKKVARAVKTRAINYTVLLDDKNRAGARFNGGELPATVLVDAGGNVRRRFIGARSLPVFEAMIAEASQPLRQTKKPTQP